MDAGWIISHPPTLNTSLNCHPALDQSECPLMPANIWHLVETLRQTIMFLCFLLTTEQFRRRLPTPFIAELHMSHEQLFRPQTQHSNHTRIFTAKHPHESCLPCKCRIVLNKCRATRIWQGEASAEINQSDKAIVASHGLVRKAHDVAVSEEYGKFKIAGSCAEKPRLVHYFCHQCIRTALWQLLALCRSSFM